MESNRYVESVTLATERDQKVGFADIKIGDIKVRGITVWRSGNGRMRVFFPSYSTAHRIFADCIDVPSELRSEIEAEVIAAYRTKKRESERGPESTNRDQGERLVPAV